MAMPVIRRLSVSPIPTAKVSLVAGSTAHYDASQLTGLTSGESIASLPDLSGNGYTMTQSVSTNQPTFTPGSINLSPAIHFNGNQWLSGTLPLAANSTVFVACSPQYFESYSMFLRGSSGYAAAMNNANPYVSSVAGTNLIDTSTSLAQNTPAIITFQANGTSSIVRLNGAQTTGNSGVGSASTTVYIGASSTGQSGVEAWIGEIVVYNNVLTAAQISQNEQYLSAKWMTLPQPATPISATSPFPSALQSLGSWTLAFDDEFTGNSLDTSRWGNFNGQTTPSGLVIHGSNVVISNGQAAFLAPAVNSGSKISSDPAVGAGANGFLLMPGDIAEARVMFPGNGASFYNWPTWWTTGDGSNWPAGGEIDIAEVGQGGTYPLQLNYHYGTGPNGSSESGIFIYPAIAGQWRIMTFYRGTGTGGYQVYLDGYLVAQWTSQDNGVGQGLTLSNGTSSSATGNGAIYGSQATLYADYVRAWKPA